MSISIKELAQKIDQLRADLAAANTALTSIAQTLTPEQQAQAAKNMEQLIAQRAAIYAELPTALVEQQAWIEQLKAAENRALTKLKDLQYSGQT